MDTKELKNLPTLNSIVNLVGKKNPLHSKNIRNYLQSCSDDFLKLAESYLSNYVSFLNSRNCKFEFIVNSYLLVVEDTLREQIRFSKTGKYKYTTFKETLKNIYSNKDYMFKYMIGLALTQFFWKNHSEIFLFFKQNILTSKGTNYLEIGPGHGLFLIEAIRSNLFGSITAIDVSETSLNMCRDLISFYLDLNNKNIAFKLIDIYDYNDIELYDFITMGEVLEHIETPQDILKKIFFLLKPNGFLFISTCVNCPAIDHIYLFNNVDEVRFMFEKCRFKLKKELILPIESLAYNNMGEKKVALNYCALLYKGIV